MAVRATAEIDVRADGKEYIYNVSVTDEADYELLQEWWPTLTGMRLQWLDELPVAPPYSRPPWMGWTNEPDGWHPAAQP